MVHPPTLDIVCPDGGGGGRRRRVRMNFSTIRPTLRVATTTTTTTTKYYSSTNILVIIGRRLGWYVNSFVLVWLFNWELKECFFLFPDLRPSPSHHPTSTGIRDVPLVSKMLRRRWVGFIVLFGTIHRTPIRVPYSTT
jgi:hypothetical protein